MEFFWLYLCLRTQPPSCLLKACATIGNNQLGRRYSTQQRRPGMTVFASSQIPAKRSLFAGRDQHDHIARRIQAICMDNPIFLFTYGRHGPICPTVLNLLVKRSVRETGLSLNLLAKQAVSESIFLFSVSACGTCITSLMMPPLRPGFCATVAFHFSPHQAHFICFKQGQKIWRIYR